MGGRSLLSLGLVVVVVVLIVVIDVVVVGIYGCDDDGGLDVHLGDWCVNFDSFGG